MISKLFWQREEHFNFITAHQNTVRQNLTTKSDVTVAGIQSGRQTLETSTAKHDELTSKLSNLLDEMKVLVDESRNNNQVVRGVANNLESIETQVKTDLAENIGKIDEFKNQMTNNNATMATTLGECEMAASTIKSKVTEMVQVSRTNDEYLMASLSDMDKNFVEQKSTLTDKVYDMFNQIEDTCEMTRIHIDGGLNGVVKDVSIEQDRIDAHQFDFEDTLSTLEATQKEFHETIQSDIGFCAERLQKFQSEELQLYTPTGQTPSKREYQYPRALAATSPHGKIIADFWQTHNPADLDCSAIISEVSHNAFDSFVFFFQNQKKINHFLVSGCKQW